MLYNTTSFYWDAPRPVDTSCMQLLIEGLEYEIGQIDPNQPSVPGNFYFWGSGLAAQARLALVA
jgi:endo-1,3(4)-beta-glucanase